MARAGRPAGQTRPKAAKGAPGTCSRCRMHAIWRGRSQADYPGEWRYMFYCPRCRKEFVEIRNR